MNKLLLVTILLLYAESSQAQEREYTASGYITDATTGEKISDALIYIINTNKNTTSNNYGFYSITSKADSISLSLSRLGYKPKVISMPLNKNVSINVELFPTSNLKEVIISSNKIEENITTTLMGIQPISKQTIETTPVLLGEPDILKTIQLLPGIKSGDEGSAGLYVRGGSPDQNLILLDGVPVYNVFHLFGFFSTFNSDAINDVKLIKGGIPARYGGRLSSVLDISMKEGNNKEKHGVIALSPIAGRVTYEAPIKTDTSSFIISARRTWIDALLNPFMKDQVFGYNFHDINLKYNTKTKNGDKFFLSLYTGRDKFFITIKEASSNDNFSFDFKWGNLTTVARWNKVISPKIFANFSSYYSKYKFSQGYKANNNNITSSKRNSSKIREIALKADFDYFPNSQHTIKFGTKLSTLQFTPETVEVIGASIDSTFNNQNTTNSLIGDIYIEDEFDLTKKIKVNTGIRTSLFHVKSTDYLNIQPRFSLRYLVNASFSMKVSYTKMFQHLHLLTNSTIGVPTDLWVSSTDRTKPQESEQIALGIAKSTKENKYQVTLEGYYKKMNNLITYANGANYLYGINETWEDKVIVGKGESYGVELFLNKKKGKLTGWLGYTLSYTNRQFDEINKGKKYPFKFDRRHDLSLLLNYKLNQNKGFNMVFVYGTGNAVTLPTANYRGLLPPFYEYTSRHKSDYNDFYKKALVNERNNFRTPSFHRMDISYQTSKNTKKGNKRTWTFSVNNVYNQQNPYFLFEEEGKLKQFSLLPIIPSINYRLEF